MEPQQIDIQKVLRERFGALPAVVQNAITSADIEKHLRELADVHKLHLDQWGALENEVMLALLGIQRMEDLEPHIKAEVGLDDATAHALAEDISRIVFAPVRQELERSLEHPDAVTAVTSGIEDMRAQMLAKEAVRVGQETITPAIPPIASLTPIASAVATQTPSVLAVAPIPPTAPATPVASSTPAVPAIVPATPPAPAPTATVERAPISTAYVPATPSHERKTIEGDPYREQLQ